MSSWISLKHEQIMDVVECVQEIILTACAQGRYLSNAHISFIMVTY